MVEQDGPQHLAVLGEGVEGLLRDGVERFVGRGEDRERALAGERLGQAGALEQGDERGEVPCRDGRLDNVGLLHHLGCRHRGLGGSWSSLSPRIVSAAAGDDEADDREADGCHGAERAAALVLVLVVVCCVLHGSPPC